MRHSRGKLSNAVVGGEEFMDVQPEVIEVERERMPKRGRANISIRVENLFFRSDFKLGLAGYSQ